MKARLCVNEVGVGRLVRQLIQHPRDIIGVAKTAVEMIDAFLIAMQQTPVAGGGQRGDQR